MDLESRIAFQNTHWGIGTFDTFPYKRHIYETIWSDIDTKLISLITGPRRVGKSVLIKQLINGLLQQKTIDPKQIIFFEFSPRDTIDTIWNVFTYFTKEVADPMLPQYLFFDEIQYIDGYESVIKELYDNSKAAKIFLTGSLSLTYKRKMDESLGGRFFSYRMFPLTFTEYLELTNSDRAHMVSAVSSQSDRFKRDHALSLLNAEFRTFLALGRFPEILSFTRDQALSYLINIITQSLNQDAFTYFSIEKPHVMNALFAYFKKNNGSLISINSLAKEIGTSNQTVTLYINILEQMNLVYLVYNTTHPLVQTQSSKKIYINSSFALLDAKFDIQTSLGFAVESYVLERLLEQGETVTFWRSREKEIDFLLPKKKIAYEVKFRSTIGPLKRYLPDFDLQCISLDGSLPACLF